RSALRRASMSVALLQVHDEVGAHPLAKEHGVMALHHPLAPAVGDHLDPLVLLHLVERAVARQLEHDYVVEVPAVDDVEPADELDPVLLRVLADVPREQGLHVELEERVATATDVEVGRQHGHLGAGPPAARSGWGGGYSRTPGSAGSPGVPGASEA